MIIDFHVHTEHSFDCFFRVADMVALARQRGLDGVAVTDHNTIRGAAEARKLAPDLYVIAGEEISTPDGDVLGLFLREEVRPQRDIRHVIREIRAQGGLAVLAHPFKWPHLLRRDDIFRQVDAVEVLNARNNIPLPFLENALCRRRAARLGFAFIAGSDTHEGFELGLARTVFEFSAAQATDERIRQAILKRRATVEGGEIDLAREVVSHFSRNIRSVFTRVPGPPGDRGDGRDSFPRRRTKEQDTRQASIPRGPQTHP